MPEASRAAPRADVAFDAKDQGCGELVLTLKRMLDGMAPGSVLELRALDPGAVQDIPAWCRLTRHELVHARPDMHRWWIRRRSD